MHEAPKPKARNIFGVLAVQSAEDLHLMQQRKTVGLLANCTAEGDRTVVFN